MNWADIQQWKSARLKAYAAECENNQRKLRDAGDALGARLDSLIGSSQTVNAAKAALHKQIVAIEKEVNFLISSAEIASEGVQGINEIRANIDDAKQLAHSWKMTIDSNGNVSMDAAVLKAQLNLGHHWIEIEAMVGRTQQRVNSALEQARSLVESLSQKWMQEPTITTFTTPLPIRYAPHCLLLEPLRRKSHPGGAPFPTTTSSG